MKVSLVLRAMQFLKIYPRITVFQSKQLSEKAVSSKNAENDANENPEHIDVVSVEIVNVLDGDDSVASADDFVPEIPSIAQVSLN